MFPQLAEVADLENNWRSSKVNFRCIGKVSLDTEEAFHMAPSSVIILTPKPSSLLLLRW